MRAIYNFIFNHSYYKEITTKYNEAVISYNNALAVWGKYFSCRFDDSFETKEYIASHLPEIIEVDSWIKTFESIKRFKMDGLKWFYHNNGRQLVLSSISYIDYKQVASKVEEISILQNYIDIYYRLRKTNQDAIEKYIKIYNLTERYEQIKEIAIHEKDIEEISLILTNAYFCRHRYPWAWRSFALGRSFEDLTLMELKSIQEKKFLSKNCFLMLFNREKELIKLIKGSSLIDINSFSDKALEQENEIWELFLKKERYLKNILKEYDEIKSNYPAALKVWMAHKNYSPDSSFADREHIVLNRKEICQVDKSITAFKEIEKKNKEGLIWFFYKKNTKYLPPTTYLEYKFIFEERNAIKKFQEYHNIYIELLNLHREAISIYLQSNSTKHTYEQKEQIVNHKSEIVKISGILKTAQKCETQYKMAWEKFSDGKKSYELPVKMLKNISEKAFCIKDQFLSYYYLNPKLTYLILGTQSHQISSFSKKTIEQEEIAVKFLSRKEQEGCNHFSGLVSLGNSDEHKRAILDSIYYGKIRNFNDSVSLLDLYVLRKNLENIKVPFDFAIQKVNENEKAIRLFNQKRGGKAEIYINDYLLSVTEGSDLYFFIDSFKNKERQRFLVRQLKENYELGFSDLVGLINIDAFKDSTIQEILAMADKIKSRHRHLLEEKRIQKELEKKRKLEEQKRLDEERRRKEEELKREEAKRVRLERERREREEAEKRRLEEIRKRQDEENRKKQKVSSLLNCTASWNYPSRSSVRYFALYYYYPTSCDWEANTEEWEIRKLLWDFKANPNKPQSEIEIIRRHESALNHILPKLVKVIEHFFCYHKYELTLVCIPSSKRVITERRYRDFAEKLCNETGIANGYYHVHITEEGEASHLGGSIKAKLSVDASFFDGRYIILFDDVITSGRSMERFKHLLESAGATVIGGLSLGKTKHERQGANPIDKI